MEIKNKTNYDPLEDIQYMPNKRYNEDATRKFLLKDDYFLKLQKTYLWGSFIISASLR